MGAFAADEGVYQYDQAVANRLNAATISGINETLWQAQQQANLRERERRNRRAALIDATQKKAQATVQRLRQDPTHDDIESGAAMNAILDELSNPKVMAGSTLSRANAKLDARLIRDIPFRDATEAITITLSQLTDEKSWPASLRDSKFDAERQAYTKAVADALEEDKNGELSKATVQQVRDKINVLYRRVGEVIPATKQPDHLEAMNYLKGLAGFTRMLEKPKVEQVLAELSKIDQTSVGNLIAFMHAYNLRFGAADTPAQKKAYLQLYPLLVSTRDQLVGKPTEATAANIQGSPNAPAPPAGSATTGSGFSTQIFHGMDPRVLYPSANANQIPNPPTPSVSSPKVIGGSR
jgi:hypothetical protein